ncbi:3'-5' exonuclease [Pantoea ananatis]
MFSCWDRLTATPANWISELIYLESRPQLLEALNRWFADNDPDVIIGWNVVQFDLRVLQKHADRFTAFRYVLAASRPRWVARAWV